jgi:hypothetical protein
MTIQKNTQKLKYRLWGIQIFFAFLSLMDIMEKALVYMKIVDFGEYWNGVYNISVSIRPLRALFSINLVEYFYFEMKNVAMVQMPVLNKRSTFLISPITEDSSERVIETESVARMSA